MEKLLLCLLCATVMQTASASTAFAGTYGGKHDHNVVDVGSAGQPVAGGKYKTGDVIEVLYNSYKGWETAVVMPYVGSDYPGGRERWLRAYMPSLPNQVTGFEVTLDKVRPGKLANLNAPEEWYDGEVSTIADALLKQKFGTQSATKAPVATATPRTAASANSAGASTTPRASTAAAVANATAPSPVSSNPYPVTSKPGMKGSVPDLSGTAWKQLMDHDVPVVPLFLFCKSGHWEVVRYAGAVGGAGKWRTSGTSLTLTDSADGRDQNYSMTYDAGKSMLFLKGGGVTFRLLYNGTTQCP